MTSIIRVIISLLLIAVFQCNGLKTGKCNPKIIANILKKNNCPKDVLCELHSMSPFTYTVNPANTVPASVKCASGYLDQPVDKTTGAHVTIYFKDVKVKPVVNNYKHYEQDCGHIKEIDANNAEFQIYLLRIDPVFCYYRCTNSETTDPDFGACAVPISKRTDQKVLAAVQQCKKELTEVGLNVGFADMIPCSQK